MTKNLLEILFLAYGRTTESRAALYEYGGVPVHHRSALDACFDARGAWVNPAGESLVIEFELLGPGDIPHCKQIWVTFEEALEMFTDPPSEKMEATGNFRLRRPLPISGPFSPNTNEST